MRLTSALLSTLSSLSVRASQQRMIGIATTTDSAEAADKLKDAITAAALVPSRAAIQTVPIRAFYWWEGLQNDTETR